MSVAALYDIHGNLPALEAVLHTLADHNIERVVVGGDVVPGPMARETLERLQRLERPVSFLLGNTDREVLALMQGVETDWFRDAPPAWRAPIEWCAGQLGVDHQRSIERWPASVTVSIPGVGSVLFCHGTPNSDSDIFTERTPEDVLVPVFDSVTADVVVCGHTHMQFDRCIGGVRVLNAGSVGMPFGEPGAYWLTLGPDIQLRRTEYDLAAACERIRATDDPQADGFAANSVMNPPPAGQMLDVFGRSELGKV